MPNISGADSARKAPQPVSYGFGNEARELCGAWYPLESVTALGIALRMLFSNPLATLPYVAVTMDNGQVVWICRKGYVRPEASYIPADLAAEAAAWEKETEIPF